MYIHIYMYVHMYMYMYAKKPSVFPRLKFQASVKNANLFDVVVQSSLLIKPQYEMILSSILVGGS